MNPLTNARNLQKLNERELELGLTNTSTSWHAKYKDSAWIFAGGLPYELTEGDLICVFSQYGEIVNLNLVRDKDTGKSKGFAFVCYEDQRSTILAVDNFNYAKLLSRTIRVDHVENYRVPKEYRDEDNLTTRLRQEGCAPTTASLVAPAPPTSPTVKRERVEEKVEEEEEATGKKKTKKEKKKKKKEKSKKIEKASKKLLKALKLKVPVKSSDVNDDDDNATSEDDDDKNTRHSNIRGTPSNSPRDDTSNNPGNANHDRADRHIQADRYSDSSKLTREHIKREEDRVRDEEGWIKRERTSSRERHTEKHIDRDRDRRVERQSSRSRSRERWPERHTDKGTRRSTERGQGRDRDRQLDRQTGEDRPVRQRSRDRDHSRNTERQRERHRSRSRDRHTDRHRDR